MSPNVSFLALVVTLTLTLDSPGNSARVSFMTRISRDFTGSPHDPCDLEQGSNAAFHRATNHCYALDSAGPCSENMKFYSLRWPSPNFGDCFCDRDLPCVYNSTTKKCHVLFSKAYCPPDYWLRLNEFGNLECEQNPCPHDTKSNHEKFVIVNGVCAKLGEACGISASVGFRYGSFRPECISQVNDLGSVSDAQTESIAKTEQLPISCQNGTEWSPTLKICVVPTAPTQENFRTVALHETNDYRAIHKALPLIQDEAIDKIAQAYADELSSTNSFVHSMRRDLGENLYYVKGHFPQSKSLLVQQAIKAWYNEVKDYDYNLPLFDSHTAHFTQLVWKSSERQGVGVAMNPTTNYSVVVVNYFPSGNLEGEFFENVGRPLNKTSEIQQEFDDSLFTIF